MASLNAVGASNARALVGRGDVDKTSDWSFSAEDGNALLGANGDDWTNYAKWFFGVDASADPKTKDHYKYPFGKGGKVYRSALIAAKQRAAQQGDTAIESEAGALLDKVDGKAMPLKRAWSRFTIKAAVDPTKRTFEGIASTPSTDRMGDVVEPKGAQFKLPIPLLYQHNSDQPIGHITDAKVTSDGIKVKGYVEQLDGPPSLKERLDVAWAEMKAGLVKGLSIGFNPLSMEPVDPKSPYGGMRFTDWEWLELSAVTIPANADASITAIKSIDQKSLAASGRKAMKVLSPPPGVSGKPSKRLEGNHMKMQEQIAALEATRAATDARLSAIMETAAGEGRPTNDEEAGEYDELSVQLKRIDADLVRFHERQKAMVESAQPVEHDTGTDPDKSAKIRNGDFRLKSPKLERGIGFTRVCGALALAKGNRSEASQFAKARWGDSHPEIAAMLSIPDVVMKTAVNAGTTTDSNFASALVQYTNLASEFVDYLRPATIIGKMPGLRKVPFNIRFPSQTGPVSVGWVGQGNAAPASSQVFATNTLGFAKLSAIVAITEELAMFSSPSSEMLLRDDLTKSVAVYMDQQFIDPAVAASANVSPASITNGVTVSIASANPVTLASIENDVAAVFQNLIGNNVPMDGLVWVMTPTTALYISQIRTTNGPYAFPDINVNGGTWKGFPVITSNSVPHSTSAGSIIVLTRPDDVFMADDGGVQIDASQEASVQMNTAPSNSAASLLSLWQSGLLGIRITKVVNWQRRRDVSTTYLDQVHFTAN